MTDCYSICAYHYIFCMVPKFYKEKPVVWKSFGTARPSTIRLRVFKLCPQPPSPGIGALPQRKVDGIDRDQALLVCNSHTHWTPKALGSAERKCYFLHPISLRSWIKDTKSTSFFELPRRKNWCRTQCYIFFFNGERRCPRKNVLGSLYQYSHCCS